MSTESVTDVTATTEVAAGTTTSTSITTSTSTSDSFTTTITSESAITSVTSVSSIFVSPSTTIVPAPTTQPSVIAVTSTVTQSPTSAGGAGSVSIKTIYSTAPAASTAIISTPTSASSTSSPSALSASGSGSSGKSGLSTGGTIAIAVVIPIVAIAALFFLGLFFWRRRKQQKTAEEQRKAEIEDYGFNPNQDPTLATAAYAETGSEMAEDNSGYRGWGTTTSAQRKPSTTLGSGSRNAAGVAAGTGMSETSSTQGGNAYTHVPSEEAHNGEGLATGALAGGAMGAAASRRRSNDQSNIHRGPSNASSAYSAGPAHNDASEEMPSGAPGQYYHEEGPYNYIDAQAQQGPYGDGTYHPSGQPVIRNNPARRNTRIERAPTYPNVGIAQNF